MPSDDAKISGENLKQKMSLDFNSICNELMLNGIVYESQYISLDSQFCKTHTLSLTEIFSSETSLNIFYSYDLENYLYIFYDSNRFNTDTAVKKTQELVN